MVGYAAQQLQGHPTCPLTLVCTQTVLFQQHAVDCLQLALTQSSHLQFMNQIAE